MAEIAKSIPKDDDDLLSHPVIFADPPPFFPMSREKEESEMEREIKGDWREGSPPAGAERRDASDGQPASHSSRPLFIYFVA